MPSYPRRALSLLLAALLGVCFAAPAQATRVDPYSRDRVVALLSTEPFEPTLEDWKRIGPQANRILVELADDDALRPSVRFRALGSLAWFPSRRSRSFLMHRLYGRRAQPVEMRVAMRALALAFGDDVFQDLRGFLNHEDGTVREGAVRALGIVRGERVRILLENHLAVEPEIWLRRIVEEVLDQLRRPPPKGRPAVES